MDIEDRELIETAILKCFKNKKKSRPDIVRFCEKYPTLESQVDLIQSEIKSRNLILKPIRYTTRTDPSSHKVREIGIQDIKQQIFDYVVIEAFDRGGFLKRIGEYQCASIPKRGQSYGLKAIKRWMKEEDAVYACKLDIKKFYPSIDREKLMAWLRKRIKNEPLLWMIEALIYTFKNGLSIGSYLSQYLANLYLSDVYHKIQEEYARVRKCKDGTIKRVRLVKHNIFYMDDFLLLGSNKRDIQRCVDLIIAECEVKGLTIKEGYHIYKIDSIGFVDMMGFRIYRTHVSIRRETCKHIRRTYLRFKKKRNSVRLAQRIISFQGLINMANCFNFKKKYDAYKSFAIAKTLISTQSKLALA